MKLVQLSNVLTLQREQYSRGQRDAFCGIVRAKTSSLKGSKEAADAEACGILRFHTVSGSPSSPVAGTNSNSRQN